MNKNNYNHNNKIEEKLKQLESVTTASQHNVVGSIPRCTTKMF